jgi:tetratricopeptide (TPR) repeat protein
MTTAPESQPPTAPRDIEVDRQILRGIRAIAVAGDMPRAAALADEALNRGLEHPFLLNLSAVRLEGAGRLQEALARLQRAAELAPLDTAVLNALGMCLQRLDRPIEALERFDAVLQIDRNAAFAHANRGAALLAQGLLSQAEAAY